MLKRIFNNTLLVLIFIFITNNVYAKRSTKKVKKISLFRTEFSIFGSASKYSNSSDVNSYVTSWGSSFGITFAGTETIEFEYRNAYQKSRTDTLLVKTFYDTYGVNYLHALSSGRFQPFIKLGIGYVRSRYQVTSNIYPEMNKSVKRSPTISYTGGFGLRIIITQNVSLKASYTAQYIDSDEDPNGDSNTEFNYFLTGGVSFVF